MGSSQTTVQQTDPWAPAQPYIIEGLEDANAMWNADPNQFVVQPWDGPSVAAQSNSTKGALAGYEQARVEQRGALTGAQKQLQNTTNAATRNTTTGAFDQAVNRSMSIMNDPRFEASNQAARGAKEGALFNTEVGQAANLQRDGTLNQALSRTMSSQPSQQYNQAMTAQMNAGNPASVDSVIRQMTGDGYTEDLRNSLRQNVNEAVMPGMNATFSGAGQTGSSLHQQNLAKGLASGMAPVEAQFINQANDRQLQAGQLGLNANNAAMDQRFRGAQALDATRQSGLDRSLVAGQMGADDSYQRTALGLEAGNTANQSNLSYLDRRTQAGNDLQAQQMQRLGFNVQGGQMAQDAYMQNQSLGLQGLGMQPMMSEATYNPLAQQLQAGQITDQRAQAQLNADILADQQRQVGPIDAINNYLSLTNNLGSSYGTSMQQSQNNPGLLDVFGAGLSMF